MKKVLYGTSALATMAMLAVTTGELAASEPIQAGVRGYHREYFAGAYQDIDESPGQEDADVAYFDHHFDNEIHFRGSTVLDNGLTVGFRVELEGRTDGDQIDEAFIFVDGDDFGRFLIGDENSAAYLMHYSQPVPTTIDQQETDVGLVNGILPDSFDLADTAIDSTLMRANDNDSGKIMYFTPRIAGIQLGVSYAAIAEAGGDDNSSLRDDDQWNNVAVGLNFLEDFNGVGVAVSGGFVYADTSQSGPQDDADDLYGVNTGFNVTFDGWTVGGSFAYLEGSSGSPGRGTATEQETLFDSWGYSFGVSYETGPYTVGAAYQKGKSSGLAGDGERNFFDQFLVGFNYALGAGVDWEITGVAWDADGERRNDLSSIANGTDSRFQNSTGYGVTTGIALSF